MKENNQNQQQSTTNDQFDYINQKPEVSRGQYVVFGVIITVLIIGGIVAFFALVGALCDCLSRPAFGKAPTQETISENKPVEITHKDSSGVNESFSGISDATDSAVGSDHTQNHDNAINDNRPTPMPGDEPVYAQVYTEFTIYEGALSDNVILEPVSSYDFTDGYYALEPGKVYNIYWDAAPLFSNKKGKVDAHVDVRSDAFQIEEGATSNISIELCDHTGQVNYWGSLGITSASGDLSIEFCADECRFAYGGEPTIENYGYVPESATSEMRFVLSFYTSGSYVGRKSSSRISGAFGKYSYECSVDDCTASAFYGENTCDPAPIPVPMPPTDDEVINDHNDQVEHPAPTDNPGEQTIEQPATTPDQPTSQQIPPVDITTYESSASHND